MDIRSRAARMLASLLLLSTVLARPATASQEFLDLIIETGDAIGGVALAGADACTAQAFNEVKTALRKGRLSGGGNWVETDEEIRLHGACPGSQVDVFWLKRTGKLFVRASLGCACTGKGPTDLETGTVRFFMPVQQLRRADGSSGYRIGSVGDFTIEAKCCMSRRAEPTLTVFDGSGARRTPANARPASPPASTPTAPAPSSTPMPQPAPPVQPPPVTAPVAPQPSRPAWSEHNPCPDCAQEKRIVDSIAQRLASIDAEIQSTQELLDANDRKRLQAQHRIDDIDTRLDSEEGTGGESFDPHTGITIRSYDQGDGTVKVDTIGPNNELIDSYSYPRRSSQELTRERAEREAEVQAADDEAVRLRTQLNRAQRTRASTQADLDQAQRVLRDCIATRCGGTPSVSSAAPAAAPATAPDTAADTALAARMGAPTDEATAPTAATAPAPGCDGSAITQQQDLGAIDDYKGLDKKLESAASSLAGKAIGGLLGGSGGFALGGGGMNDTDAPGPDGPDTVDDPIDDELKQTFTDPATGTSIKVGMRLDGDTLLVSTDLVKTPDKGTLHAVVLENPDTCQAQPATRYLPYRLYQGWSLDIDWTHDRYVDGKQVSHEEGSSHTEGVLDRGEVRLPAHGTGDLGAAAGFTPAWKYFGFPTPYGGVQSMGSEFKLSERQRRDLLNLAVHVTREYGDRIRTVVFPLHVLMEAYLTRQALLNMGYRFPQDRIAPPPGDVMKIGGGATQIDPPAAQESPEDILEEIDEEIVIN